MNAICVKTGWKLKAYFTIETDQMKHSCQNPVQNARNLKCGNMVKLKIICGNQNNTKIELCDEGHEIDITRQINRVDVEQPNRINIATNVTNLNINANAGEPIRVKLEMAFAPDDFILESESNVHIDKIDIRRRIGD